MARRKKPPLFELAREARLRASAAPAQPRAPEPVEQALETSAGLRWLAPGRTVRVPVGYLFLAGAVFVAGLIGAYVFGYTRGGAAREQQLLALRSQPQPAADPLLADRAVDAQPTQAPAEQVASINQGPSLSDLGPTPMAAQPADAPPSVVADPLVIEDAALDPREPGMNYYVVDRLRPNEAVEAARYLRLHGIEAVVLPSDSPSLRLVVALRPFAPGKVSSPESKAYAARIREIGRRWKTQDGGVSDFSTMYAAKHQP